MVRWEMRLSNRSKCPWVLRTLAFVKGDLKNIKQRQGKANLMVSQGHCGGYVENRLEVGRARVGRRRPVWRWLQCPW